MYIIYMTWNIYIWNNQSGKAPLSYFILSNWEITISSLTIKRNKAVALSFFAQIHNGMTIQI